MAKYTKVEIASDLFDYDESGFSYSLLDNNEGAVKVPLDYESDLEEAVEECPTGSIKTSESPFLNNSVAN